jgi:hypothetical protein
MELSILIAQIYAVLLIAVGLGLILSPSYYRNALSKMMTEAGTVYIGGAAALLVGFLILNTHWVWTGWPTLATLIGVIATLKGFGLLVFPGVMVRVTKRFTKHSAFIPLWGAFAFLLGLTLAYFGWIVR